MVMGLLTLIEGLLLFLRIYFFCSILKMNPDEISRIFDKASWFCIYSLLFRILTGSSLFISIICYGFLSMSVSIDYGPFSKLKLLKAWAAKD